MTTSTYSVDAITTGMYPMHPRAIARRTLLVLAIAGAGYAAGVFFHGPDTGRSEAAAFAAPAQAAEPNRRAPATTSVSVPPAAAVDLGSDDGRIQDPRECDVAKGIEYACMFMD